VPSATSSRLPDGDPAPPRGHWTELVKFSLVGGSGFLVNLAVYGLAIHALGLHYLSAATLAFVVANASNYLLNRYWTFPGAGNPIAAEYARFLAVGGIALVGNLALLSLFIERVRLPPLIAQMAAILLLTPTTFIANKVWTFRRRG
jgi:putative flippase GtrA